MIDLQETFLCLKVKLIKGNVALEADDAMFVKNTMHSLFCEVYFNNEQVYTSNDYMLTKRSSLMNFLIRKEPRVLFAHVKVIRTRKNRHRSETNPSSLVKQRRTRKFAFMGS